MAIKANNVTISAVNVKKSGATTAMQKVNANGVNVWTSYIPVTSMTGYNRYNETYPDYYYATVDEIIDVGFKFLPTNATKKVIDDIIYTSGISSYITVGNFVASAVAGRYYQQIAFSRKNSSSSSFYQVTFQNNESDSSVINKFMIEAEETYATLTLSSKKTGHADIYVKATDNVWKYNHLIVGVKFTKWVYNGVDRTDEIPSYGYYAYNCYGIDGLNYLTYGYSHGGLRDATENLDFVTNYNDYLLLDLSIFNEFVTGTLEGSEILITVANASHLVH